VGEGSENEGDESEGLQGRTRRKGSSYRAITGWLVTESDAHIVGVFSIEGSFESVEEPSPEEVRVDSFVEH
jgi:hypothetical protein